MEETVNMNNTNNKVMTLDGARLVLEQEGMACDYVTNQCLVGKLSKCHWELFYKVDTIVLVQKVPGVLTCERYLSDLHRLPELIEEHHVGVNDCPPFGFHHGRHVMLVYYADTVESVLGNEITNFPSRIQYCCPSYTFVAAQDALGQSFHLPELKSSTRGYRLSSVCHYRAQKLTGVSEEHLRPPPFLSWFTIMNIMVWLVNIINFIHFPWLSLFCIPFLLHFLVAAIMQCRRKRNSRMNAGSYGHLPVSVSDDDGSDEETCHIHMV
jgi:hypothetical protein